MARWNDQQIDKSADTRISLRIRLYIALPSCVNKWINQWTCSMIIQHDKVCLYAPESLLIWLWHNVRHFSASNNATAAMIQITNQPSMKHCNVLTPLQHLPPQSLSMHALPCTLHYMNRGHLPKCCAKYKNIPSASLVIWLLNYAEQVIQNSAINLKISLKE